MKELIVAELLSRNNTPVIEDVRRQAGFILGAGWLHFYNLATRPGPLGEMLGMDLTRPAVQKYFSSPDHHTFFSSRVFSRKTRALSGGIFAGIQGRATPGSRGRGMGLANGG
jgi:hypothetical protein